MSRRAVWRSLAACAALWVALSQAAVVEPMLRIASGSERGTAIDAARDLSVLVAPNARVGFEVIPTAGAAENVHRLRHERDVRLALVQRDVYQAYVDLAAGGDAEAADLIRPLRVVMPLFTEEIYFVVRADSPLKFIDEIRDARINLGERGSGSALTAAALYRLMFDEPVPLSSISNLTSEEALAKLVTDGSVDVVVIVSGQPMRLLEDMKPEARQYVKLLRFSEGHPSSDRVLQRYVATTVRARHYPNVLARDIDALAVQTLLMTREDAPDSPAARDALVRFAEALCRNFGRLQRHGHPKWREADLALPELPQGWRYHAFTAMVLSECRARGGPATRR